MSRPPNVIPLAVVEDCEIVKSTDALRCLKLGLRFTTVSGAVNKVYSSEKATLRFAHFEQSNLDIITLDLSTVSRHTGTEVSGFLGFAMLRQLEIELDYRDGLVDFK